MGLWALRERHVVLDSCAMGMTSAEMAAMEDTGDAEDRDPVRVFLLDDHEIVRQGLRELLESTGEFRVVGEAGTVEQTLARIGPGQVDIAVLDVRLPDGNGVDACRRLRERHPDLAVLILTSFADDEAVVAAAEAGAQGYALKELRSNEIVSSLRSIAAGRPTLDAATVKQARARASRGDEDDQLLARLTDQERRIFELIGEGRSNRQIAETMYLAEKTIKNYVSNMLDKLSMDRRTEVAAAAARMAERRRRAL